MIFRAILTRKYVYKVYAPTQAIAEFYLTQINDGAGEWGSPELGMKLESNKLDSITMCRLEKEEELEEMQREY